MNSNEKFMVFIDGSNVFHGQDRLNFKIDYKKFRDLLKTDRNIIRIYYYEGVRTPITAGKNKYFKSLRHLEMDVLTRPLRKRKFECKKCDYKTDIYYEKGIDASLSTDLLWHAFQKSYDTAIIITSDDDFMPPIKRVKLLGRRVEVWGFKESIGRDLKKEADKIIYINDIIDQIKK